VLCKRPITSNPHPAFVTVLALPGLPRSTDSIPCTVTCAKFQTLKHPRSTIRNRTRACFEQEGPAFSTHYSIQFPSTQTASLSKYLIRPVKCPPRCQNQGHDLRGKAPEPITQQNTDCHHAAPKPTWFVRKISPSLVKSMLIVSVVGTSFTRRAPSTAKTLQFLGRSTLEQSIGNSITSYHR
jgi:hypothetical protein